MQRQLVGALMSSVAVTLLLLALMPVFALADNERVCPESDGWSSHQTGNIADADWGTATVNGSFVDFDVEAGWTVEVCVKGGSADPTITTIVGPDQVSVQTPEQPSSGNNPAVSHWGFRASTTTTTTSSSTTVPEETTTTVGETTTTAPTTTTTVLATTSTVDQTTTTTVEATTSSEATTTTVADTTTTEGTTDSTLPFTGSEPGDWAAVAASMLMVGGLALLVARTRHFDS